MVSLRRNSIFGVLGFLIPTVVVLLAYPVLIHALGAVAFGVFLLATGMSGVLGFLDLGFSAATLQFIAEDVARDDQRAAGHTLTTSLAYYGAVGSLAGLLLWVLTPWLVHVFSVQPDMRPQAIGVFHLGAIQLAVFFAITVFVSFFKGLHRFDLSTLILSALSALTYGAAVVGVKLYGASLYGVTAIGLAANVVVLVASAGLAGHVCRSHGIPVWSTPPSGASMHRMLRFGVFVAAEKVAALLTNQAQRLIIAGFLGPAAVTLYQTAYTVSIKGIAALRGAFEVLTPTTARLSQRMGAGSVARLRSLYLRSTAAAAVLSIGGMGTLFLVAGPLIHWWLRSPIESQVTSLVRVFCVGMAVNGITPVAYNVIAGLKRPQINTALTMLDPLVMGALLVVLGADGLSVHDFAVAYSGASFLCGVFYLVFCEVIVWRRWIPDIMMQRQQHDRALGEPA
jgi:O-antigen/teichoic acid export membrane protein